MKTAPAVVWNYYPHLVEVEQAFRNLKGDLAIRPIFHQDEARMEAHIFVSFLEKFAAIQMVDVQIPTSDGRTLLLPRYTHPEAEPDEEAGSVLVVPPPEDLGAWLRCTQPKGL